MGRQEEGNETHLALAAPPLCEGEQALADVLVALQRQPDPARPLKESQGLSASRNHTLQLINELETKSPVFRHTILMIQTSLISKRE